MIVKYTWLLFLPFISFYVKEQYHSQSFYYRWAALVGRLDWSSIPRVEISLGNIQNPKLLTM